jgi:uncharacterized membrane protein YkvI
MGRPTRLRIALVLVALLSACATTTSSGQKTVGMHDVPLWVVAPVLVILVIIAVVVVKYRGRR